LRSAGWDFSLFVLKSSIYLMRCKPYVSRTRVATRDCLAALTLTGSPLKSARRAVLFFCLAMVLSLGFQITDAFATVTLKIEIENRITTDGNCSFVLSTEPSGGLSGTDFQKNLVLDMPGFTDVKIAETDSQRKVRITAHIDRAGFYPFQVALRSEGQAPAARDYFVAEIKPSRAAFDHVGYYVFLGRGDFWDETQQLALWTLQDWKGFADWMSAHRADTLYVLLNGFTLAYPSDKYPTLRDRFSNNARYNFLRPFIDYAHSRGIRVYLTLTTDDHAQGFGTLYPETARIDRFGYAPNRRALALEDPKVRQYIVDMVQETMQLYGNADGFVFHPTEEDPDRYNEATKAAFRQETGKDLAQTEKTERYRWYNQKFAELLRSLYEIAAPRNPHFEFVMFNTWWQDDYVPVYRELLPAKFKVCVWYYDEKEEKTFRKWPIWAWVESFGANRVLYMPTGEAFLYPQEHDEQVERHIRTDRLISAAETLGVKSCIFFAGWNLGSEDDRRRDLAIAQFPTTSFVRETRRKPDLLPGLYTDYFGAREAALK
jgi:Beta-galactosidase